MDNFWIKRKKDKDRFRSRQHWGEIKTNHTPSGLVWDDLYEEEMPILRGDYVDMSEAFNIYRTELEHAQGIYERSGMILKG